MSMCEYSQTCKNYIDSCEAGNWNVCGHYPKQLNGADKGKEVCKKCNGSGAYESTVMNISVRVLNTAVFNRLNGINPLPLGGGSSQTKRRTHD